MGNSDTNPNWNYKSRPDIWDDFVSLQHLNRTHIVWPRLQPTPDSYRDKASQQTRELRPVRILNIGSIFDSRQREV